MSHPPFDLVVVTKVHKEYSKDGKKQMSTPLNVHYHAFHENPFTFPFKCVQRHMTFQMDSVNLHLEPFKSLSEVHKIYLKRLGLPTQFDLINH